MFWVYPVHLALVDRKENAAELSSAAQGIKILFGVAYSTHWACGGVAKSA